MRRTEQKKNDDRLHKNISYLDLTPFFCHEHYHMRKRIVEMMSCARQIREKGKADIHDRGIERRSTNVMPNMVTNFLALNRMELIN